MDENDGYIPLKELGRHKLREQVKSGFKKFTTNVTNTKNLQQNSIPVKRPNAFMTFLGNAGRNINNDKSDMNLFIPRNEGNFSDRVKDFERKEVYKDKKVVKPREYKKYF